MNRYGNKKNDQLITMLKCTLYKMILLKYELIYQIYKNMDVVIFDFNL